MIKKIREEILWLKIIYNENKYYEKLQIKIKNVIFGEIKIGE